MDANIVFNITVVIVGIIFLLIHAIDIFLKKGKRKDELNLLVFVLFTIFHFAVYLALTILRIFITDSDFLTTGSYTLFYIMNNVELLLLFIYAVNYMQLRRKVKNTLGLIILILFLIFIILDIVNIFVPLFFYSDHGVYQRTDFMIISQGFQLVGFIMVFFVAMLNKKLNVMEKIAFMLYCLLPFVAIILQNIFKGYAIAYLSIIVSIEILFLFVNVKKNIALAHEAKRNKEAEVKIMMSQIQPHFIYNTLASISTLIKIDPNKAQKGLDDFTEYLRTNLTSLTDTTLISFKDELRHIETYLSLEKMRFDERINVKLDIKASDFLVPPLSIQPLVENAVKHGILKKVEGGTLTLLTYERRDAYVVEIIDDGVGFNLDDLRKDNRNHIGLNNVKYRLSTMVHATLKIESEIDKGTKIIVLFNK